MPSVAIQNLGCKVNQYESERLADSFQALGFELRDFREPADVYVINSCSVTADADRKSRQSASRAARQNPDAKVVVTGCFAQMAIDTGEHVAGATLLVPNSEKMRTPAHLLAAFPDLFPYSSSPASSVPAGYELGPALFPECGPARSSGASSDLIRLDAARVGAPDAIRHAARPAGLRRTRATLKIQDGCEYFCAFCSIAYTRNTMASRPLAAILDEARQMADNGAREIVVTGVCVGAYGPNTGSGGAKLSDALVAIADVPGIERVRLSSVQPVEIPRDLIDAMASHPNIAPHLHLSAQSGDDTILRRMNRPYDVAFFEDKVAELKAAVPDIGLTTDLIVGFPGETEDLFENTVGFVHRMGFARTHVFRYSPRRRTVAADVPDDVPPQEKERRHGRLTAVCTEQQQKFAGTQVGRIVTVLAESRGREEGWLAGYTGNYVRVHFPSPQTARGAFAHVSVTGVTADGDAIGEVVSKEKI